MKPRLAYGIAFVAGFVMMGMEILGSRVLAPTFGSSVQVWGALISVFMAGLGFGYAAGGWWADRRPQPSSVVWLLLLAAILMATMPAYDTTWCQAIGRTGLPVSWGALLAATVLFAPACACLGAVSPLLIRLVTPDAEHVGRCAGRIFAIVTVGSIAGTLVTAFWLIGSMGTARAMLVMAATAFLVAAIVAHQTCAGQCLWSGLKLGGDRP